VGVSTPFDVGEKFIKARGKKKGNIRTKNLAGNGYLERTLGTCVAKWDCIGWAIMIPTALNPGNRRGMVIHRGKKGRDLGAGGAGCWNHSRIGRRGGL